MNTVSDWLSFFWGAENFWQEETIMETSYNTQYHATNRLIKACELNPSKVTHHRTTGMEMGGAHGLDEFRMWQYVETYKQVNRHDTCRKLIRCEKRMI